MRSLKIKNFVLSVSVFLLTSVFLLALVLIVDLYYHQKYLNIAGLNYKGYRNKVAGPKEKDELRIAMVGGSSIFGYGMKYYDAVPERLQVALQAYCGSLDSYKKISVFNLAYNGEGAYAFYYNLKDFFWLDYDCAIIYSCYNDLGLVNTMAYRHNTPLFRVFGYMPILPLLIKEKIMFVIGKGNLDEGYRKSRIIFNKEEKSSFDDNSLQKALSGYNKPENFMERIKKSENIDFEPATLKKDKWSWFKYFIKKAVDFCLQKNKKVIVITAPYLNDEHIRQQAVLREMLSQTYHENKNILYINLGEAFSTKDRVLFPDRMHFSPKGAQLMAEAIAKNAEGFIFNKD